MNNFASKLEGKFQEEESRRSAHERLEQQRQQEERRFQEKFNSEYRGMIIDLVSQANTTLSKRNAGLVRLSSEQETDSKTISVTVEPPNRSSMTIQFKLLAGGIVTCIRQTGGPLVQGTIIGEFDQEATENELLQFITKTLGLA